MSTNEEEEKPQVLCEKLSVGRLKAPLVQPRTRVCMISVDTTLDKVVAAVCLVLVTYSYLCVLRISTSEQYFAAFR
jgi:hypothetical protein